MKKRLEQLTDLIQQKWRLAGVRTIVGGGVTGIAVTLANRAIVMGSAIILARILGPEGYGVYVLAIALMAILSLGTEFGMYPLLVREVSVANAKGDDKTIIGLSKNAYNFAVISSLIIGTLGLGLIWATPLFSHPNEKLTLTLMLLLLPAITIIRLSSAILNGLRRLTWAQIVESLMLPGTVFVGLLMLSFVNIDYISSSITMMVQLISAILVATVVYIFIQRTLTQPNGSISSYTRVVGLQARARPFLLIGAAAMITGQLDAILVSLFLGNAETALYRVAAQCATLIWFGMQVLQSISAPYFARLYSSGDLHNLRVLFYGATILSILSSIPVLVAFFFFGELLIEIAFGKEYIDAGRLLIILSIGYAINIFCGPIGAVLSMMGKEDFVSKTLLITSMINISMAFLLIQTIGVTGAAISTSFSIALYHVALRIYGWKRCGI